MHTYARLSRSAMCIGKIIGSVAMIKKAMLLKKAMPLEKGYAGIFEMKFHRYLELIKKILFCVHICN